MQTVNSENITSSNVKDIFLRNATISLLDLLNRHIIIDLVRKDTVEKHPIPFFYNFAGDEGFMKDFFIDLPDDCAYPRFADGNYEQVPRGIVTLSSFQIRSADFTNKFVRGSFNQETRDINDQKVLKAYSSRLMTIPMSLKFDIKVNSDNMNKTFKIMERIIDFYYKNNVTYFQFRGIRIPAQVTFPEAENFTKKYDFTYSDDKMVITNFTVDMETYYPSFSDHGVFYKGNNISQVNVRTSIQDSGAMLSDSWVDPDFPPAE